MEFKGTKGKWVVDEDSTYPVHQIWSGAIYIAKTCFAPSSKANALLISKAPEMLEMLKEVIDWEYMSVYNEELYDKIEQLIKQATEI